MKDEPLSAYTLLRSNVAATSARALQASLHVVDDFVEAGVSLTLSGTSLSDDAAARR